MGSKLACENEAPYPEKLVKPLLQVTVPQGGSVCDPFGVPVIELDPNRFAVSVDADDDRLRRAVLLVRL
jgi:hypothetical protein